MTYGLEERHIINESYRTAKEYRRGQGEVEKPPGRLVDNGTEWTFSKRDLARRQQPMNGWAGQLVSSRITDSQNLNHANIIVDNDRDAARATKSIYRLLLLNRGIVHNHESHHLHARHRR